MREFLLAMAVSAALIGCDNKPEGGAKPPSEGAKAGEFGKPAEAAKPTKHAWGSFKAGSFVKLKSVNEMEIGGSKKTTETTTTQTLKDVTADDAVVEKETAIDKAPATKMEVKYPLRPLESGRVGDAPKPKTGSEEVVIAGKKMTCDWTETETDINGAKTVTRIYTNPEIPGFTAKMTVKSPTISFTEEVVEFSAK
jgi:hypothetical protein